MVKRQRENRRAHPRYPVSVDLEYSLGSSEGHSQVGRGRTINLSTGGVLFEAEASVPVKATVELCILWPLRTTDQAQVELYATGKVVRAKDRYVAVKFDRATFGTTSPRNLGGALELVAESNL